MKVVALISGGKDSCYNMVECVRYGHQIVALANLKPPPQLQKDEIDSFMYQTVGHHAIEAYAEAMDLPLYRHTIDGTAKQQTLFYSSSEEKKEKEQDEVENLYELLKKEAQPEIEAVSSGAILSNYQRNRVENVCSRLGLISLAYLWNREQGDLLKEMIESQIEAILIKVAAIGLDARHLGKSLSTLYPYLCKLHDEYESNICGEGGEYESFTLDCPIFKKRIVIDNTQTIIHSNDAYAPVAYLNLLSYHLEDKLDLPNVVKNDIPNIDIPSIPTSSPLTAYPFTNGYNIESKTDSFVYLSKTAIGPDYDIHLTSAQELHIIFHKIKESLANYNMTMKDIVFVYLYIYDMNEFQQINAAYKEYFDVNPPSRACVSVPLEHSKVMVECVAQNSQRTDVLHVQSISKWAPACIGPYSQAYAVGNMIFFAGQIALDPPSMKFSSNSVSSQLDLSLENLSQVVKSMKSSIRQTLVCNVYLTDMEYQNIALDSCASVVDKNKAIISFVQVKSLPRNAVIEVQSIGITNESGAYGITKTQKAGWSLFTAKEISFDDIKISVTTLHKDSTFLFLKALINRENVLEDENEFGAIVAEILNIPSTLSCDFTKPLYIKCYYAVSSGYSITQLGEFKNYHVTFIPVVEIENKFPLLFEVAFLNKED